MDKSQYNSVLSAHSQIEDMALVHVAELKTLIISLDTLNREVKNLKDKLSTLRIYNNQSIKELLDIKDKVLKKYRDEGLLGYRRIGDKYWYTQEDIDKFLKIIHVEPFREVAQRLHSQHN